MAKKFRIKQREYDAHEFILDDPDRPDWLTAAIAAGKVTIHADHAILHEPSIGGGELRVEPGDYFLWDPPDELNLSFKKVFHKAFEEKP